MILRTEVLRSMALLVVEVDISVEGCVVGDGGIFEYDVSRWWERREDERLYGG